MKFKKLVKASDTEVKQELQSILDNIKADKDLYMSEVVYLKEHKEDIKRLFPDEILLWEWADISEDEWRNKKSSKKVKADWQDEEFDTDYFINKIEKALSNLQKRENLPIRWYSNGNKVIITID